MTDISSFEPILVEVKAFSWEAVPKTDPPTPRDQFLIQEIMLAGGIDRTVRPGLYFFNVVPGPMGEEIITFYPK